MYINFAVIKNRRYFDGKICRPDKSILLCLENFAKVTFFTSTRSYAKMQVKIASTKFTSVCKTMKNF